MPALLDHPAVWRGRSGNTAHNGLSTLPSGHDALDEILPGGGWPLGALTEILAPRPGLGEFSLLLPTLAGITAQGRYAVLVDPPWIPYPPAMRGHDVDLQRLLLVRTHDTAESLWACEQGLRAAHNGAVLAWPQDGKERFSQLRRLQLAARSSRQCAFLFRPAEAVGSASPAGLRLHLQADETHLEVSLLKGRGARPGTSVRLHRQHAAHSLLSATARAGASRPGGARARRPSAGSAAAERLVAGDD